MVKSSLFWLLTDYHAEVLKLLLKVRNSWNWMLPIVVMETANIPWLIIFTLCSSHMIVCLAFQLQLTTVYNMLC